MRSLLLVLALSGCIPAPAEVVIHGLTLHTKPRPSGREWHEVNPGIGWRFDSGVQVGLYRDSVAKATAYSLYDWLPIERDGVQFGTFIGAKTDGKTVAIGGLVARQGQLTVRMAPAVKSKGLVFAAEWTF